ncbi:OB-fold nucleic acid binding domain-containing protein [Neosynechococcus sphagnicola]|uniref:OB-fold nucleic acid binding domain-containing protein n=1 Tax=Neosynechococcus sphagnicola TaxID=1501145 RepID=UPI0023BAF6AF|nr:OB-fold nucleic acid binding domain-containing protein [Neosynechococcus sphagnicola]
MLASVPLSVSWQLGFRGVDFQSLADLCDRVACLKDARIDHRSVNRRALEALIQCGAFDRLNSNRKQLSHDLELVLDWAQSRAKDRAIGQGNLFDLLAPPPGATTQSSYELAPKAPQVEDFPQQEKLRLEKELLGFYISDHPLKPIQQSAQVLAPISLCNLESQPEDMHVSAIVMVTAVKAVTTKKGDRMAIVQLEDLTGHAEAVVFPKSYERIKEQIQPDRRLMIWGKVDRRDEQCQLIVEDAEPIEDVRMVMVELPPQQAGDIEVQHRLRDVLKGQRLEEDKAKTLVIAIIASHDQRQLVRLGVQFRVQDAQATVSALKQANFRAWSSTLVGEEP